MFSFKTGRTISLAILVSILCKPFAFGADTVTSPSSPGAISQQVEVDAIDMVAESVTLEQLSASLYLNDCISTLTRIQRSNSKLVLTDEQYILNNALRWDGDFTKYRSLFSFRNSLQDELKDMVITEENRQRFKDAFDKKKNGASRDAILGAISGIQFNPNVFALASNIAIKSAQSFLDYDKKMDEYEAEFDKEMWQLEQEDMQSITELRKNAFSILYELFQDSELQFSEDLRLVENDFENLFNYVELPADVRIDKMVERMTKYKYLPLYWYELGKTYIELYESNNGTEYLDKAFESFDQYKSIVSKCKLYRFDYNLGNIALYELEYNDSLSTQEKYQRLDVVRNNLTNNGNALLFASMFYINELSDFRNGINLICDCLTDKTMSEHNDMLLYLSLIWNRIQDRKLKEKVSRSVLNSTDIDLMSFIGFMYCLSNDKSFDSYELFHELQKSIILAPTRNQKGDVTKYTLCNNSKLLKNDFDNWGVYLEEIDFKKNTSRTYSFDVDFNSKDKKKFFETLDDLAKKEDYFEYHRDQRGLIETQIKLGGHTYFYLSKDKTWNEISPYMTSLKPKGGEKIEKRDIKDIAEGVYNDFYDKYHVDEVSFIYVRNEESVQESEMAQYNSPKYTFVLIPAPISENSTDAPVECKLTFITDYMNGSDTEFYFDGITFGKNYVKL